MTMSNIRSGHMAGVLAAAVCALGGGAGGALASSPSPTLGSHLGGATVGFGKVKPKAVSLGGDPTGDVTKLRWKSWGTPAAVGTGKGFYVPAGKPTADAVIARVTLTASSLGTCEGHKAYKRVAFTYHYKGKSYAGASYGICGHLS
jgi:hypothetical protein